MSDAPKRVPIITPEGKFDTIGAEFADEVVRSGGRVLTKKEAEAKASEVAQKEAQAREDERYDKLPTGVKVGGALGTAASVILPGTALTFGATPGAPQPAAAYSQGITEGLTAGMGHGLVRQGIDATLGHDVGDKYAQQIEDSKTAHPIAHGAGNLIGTTAGLVGSAGTAAERLATKGLARAGVQATSALGKAGVTAAELGARGIVEGGIAKAGDYAGEQLLQDHEVATDKIIAHGLTGGVFGGVVGGGLGSLGSLAGSGLRAGFGRALSREGTELAAREGVDAGEDLAPLLAKNATRDEAIAARQALESTAAAPTAMGARGTAATAYGKRMANELAFDALNSTKGQMSKALANVAADPAAAKVAVGEYVNDLLGRTVGKDASAWQVGKVGRADNLLSMIQQDQAGRLASGMSEALKATPARVNIATVFGRAGQEVENMLRDPIRAAGAEAFWNRTSREMQALKLSGKVAEDGTMDAVDAFYLRSGLAKNAYEVTKVSGHAGDAYKSFLRDLDSETIKALDEAGNAAGKNGVGDNIRHWKRQFQLSYAAEEAAEGGAERIAGNNAIGLREGIAGATAMMTGHPILGVVGPLAMKVAKERGKAVLAHALYHAAERGTLARLVERTDNQIARASKGLITAPAKGAAKPAEVMPPPRSLITKTLARAAAFQADPEAFVDKVTQDTDAIRGHSPEIADALVQRQVRGELLIASKIPYQGEPDPLDPHPRARLTPSEEAAVARTAWYVDKPNRFFAEVERGKLVPEGAEVAQVMMPGAFADLQAATADALTTQLARGKRLPFRQRELMGQLLDFAATPAQRPEHRAFLQQNVADVLPSNERTTPAVPKSRRPMMSQNGSALDRLEGKGPGRR